MSKPFYITLPNRGQIHIEGEDRHGFLDSLISNSVKIIPEGHCVYAFLLTPQGKFLHDFFVHNGHGFLILDCEGGTRAHDLYERLLKYRLRSKVQVSAQESVPVYAIFGADLGVPDPRHIDMGRRSFEKPLGMEEMPFSVWDMKRISLCIPDGNRDFEIERSTLDEGRIDTLNGIDWNKGCYIGQELTARMKYRGLGKKHLYTVSITDGKNYAPFTDLPNGGQMRSTCGDIGIALLKDGEPTCL